MMTVDSEKVHQASSLFFFFFGSMLAWQSKINILFSYFIFFLVLLPSAEGIIHDTTWASGMTNAPGFLTFFPPLNLDRKQLGELYLLHVNFCGRWTTGWPYCPIPLLRDTSHLYVFLDSSFQ